MALLAGGRHLFLTSKAGTGKSTLIRHFMAGTDRNVVVANPTCGIESVADQLRAAASRALLPDDVVTRLHEASALLGVDVVSGAVTVARHDIGSALVPGARICFTGTALHPVGRVVEREEMERLAASAGLAPVRSVTKTRCEVLVTAEAGTRTEVSRSARMNWAKGCVSEAGKLSRSFSRVTGVGVRQMASKAGPRTHCRCAAGPSCATGRAATVTHTELVAFNRNLSGVHTR